METNKRTHDEISSDSSSKETDFTEQRKRSFHVAWDKSLEIPNPLLQKWRLELSRTFRVGISTVNGNLCMLRKWTYSYAARKELFKTMTCTSS